MLGAVMNNFAFEAPKAEPDKNKFGPNFAKIETSLGSCFAKMGTVPSEPKRGKPMCSFGLIKSVLCLQKTRALCPAEDHPHFARNDDNNRTPRNRRNCLHSASSEPRAQMTDKAIEATIEGTLLLGPTSLAMGWSARVLK